MNLILDACRGKMAARPHVQLSDLPVELDHHIIHEDASCYLLVHTKLTETSLNAIDSLAASTGTGDPGIFITFDCDEGCLILPQDAKPLKDFSFRIHKGQQKGDLECLHQSRENGLASQKLVNYGSIQARIAVQATEDVYEQYKRKARQVEEEWKQSSLAQEIQLPSDRSRSIRVKKSYGDRKRKSTVSLPKPKKMKAHPQFTFREHVVHALALKPMTMADLQKRFDKDKVKTSDQDDLSVVLEEVATLDSGVFELLKTMYAQIQVDKWPLYSDLEKQMVKRRILAAGSKSSPEIPQAQKRVLPSDDSLDERPTKQFLQVMSGDVSRPISPMDAMLRNADDKSSHQPSLQGEPKLMYNVHATPDENELSLTASSIAHGGESSSLMLLEPVMTHKMRAKYKGLFFSDYQEYLRLHEIVQNVGTEFHKMKELLEKHAPGTEEYQEIHEQIIEKYEVFQKDENYMRDKSRLQELHTRLGTIKRLVAQYDGQCMK